MCSNVLPLYHLFYKHVFDLSSLWQADSCCKWAVLSIRGPDTDEDRPVSAILPSHLADAHHQVRMLVALSVERYADLAPLIMYQNIFSIEVITI